MLRLYDIDQMVRRTRAQVRVRLGRANIQPAIHLRGIDTDDLDVRPFSQSDRGSGFARRGWAEQTDDGQWTIFRLDHSLTASYKKLGIFQLTCKRNTIECIFQIMTRSSAQPRWQGAPTQTVQLVRQGGAPCQRGCAELLMTLSILHVP